MLLRLLLLGHLCDAIDALTAVPNARLLPLSSTAARAGNVPAFYHARRGCARGTLLIGSGAAALGWRRVKETPALTGCAEAQELCQSGQIFALEDTRLDGALEFVAAHLNDVGIAPLIAKGWAVAHFYSARYLRAYGDFDLCAPPGRYDWRARRSCV